MDYLTQHPNLIYISIALLAVSALLIYKVYWTLFKNF